jgi:4-amino-4-deoxy-L-arabinose transferase-like glycosyltransferase
MTKLIETVKSNIHLWIPVTLAALLKTWLLLTGSLPFNADEAIVALMARHITQGELPTFFYGQAYMGSFDAILVALGFRIFGEQVFVIRIIQSLLYLGTVFTTALLGHRLFHSKKVALIAGLLTAVPPVNVTLYSTVSLGGYGEILLLGNLLLLSGLWIIRRTQEEGFEKDRLFFPSLFAWGAGAGFSFWVFGLSLVYAIPVVLVLFWVICKSEKQKIIWQTGGLILTGAILGSMPWWIFAIGGGSSVLISELAGGAIADITSGPGLLLPLERVGNLILFGGTVIMGLRPPWDVRWLMMPLLPFALIFWLAVLFFSLSKMYRNKNQSELWIISLIGAVLLAGFIFTPFGGDPSGRYFTPLIVPMALFGADMIASQLSRKTLLQTGLLFSILFYNLGGTIQSVLKFPPGLTTQFDVVTQIDQTKIGELIDFLKEEKIDRGYSNYWVSYPLAFLSGEDIILVPRLPYHEDFRYTARDDRYSPYGDVVGSAEEVGYVTTNHAELDNYLRQQFSARDLTWKEKRIGDYLVYYNLSNLVRPQNIGLGITTTP